MIFDSTTVLHATWLTEAFSLASFVFILQIVNSVVMLNTSMYHLAVYY